MQASVTEKRTGETSVELMVRRAINKQPVIDMHTHLYPPSFGTPVPNAAVQSDPEGLMLWGIDELLTYHYLVAEVFRVAPPSKMPYEAFWRMTKQQRADHVWRHLFIERSPISEACRGVLTTLQKLGLDPAERSLDRWRKFFAAQDPDRYVDRVMELANVSSITMTNNVFDDNERNRWLSNDRVGHDARFRSVLRIDPMLRAWPAAAKRLMSEGYQTDEKLDQRTINEARRFLRDWILRMRAIYVAASLPPEFRYPAAENDQTGRAGQAVLEKVILPECAEQGLPLSLMIGSTDNVNPPLGDAGHMLGEADVPSLVRLCREFPQNKFFVSLLSRESQHELCVAARKFSNLLPFGCWWFLNNPSLIDEITRMRFELLGTSFIPQHSDARVLDQLIYKWEHSRSVIEQALIDKFNDLSATGWPVTQAEVDRTAQQLFSGNFEEFCSSVSVTPTDAVERQLS